MSRSIADGTLKALYASVAVADILVLGGFYAPALAGLSLRTIPGIDDALPLAALALLFCSLVLCMLLALNAVRRSVLDGVSMWLCVALIMLYALISSVGFGSVYLGHI